MIARALAIGNEAMLRYAYEQQRNEYLDGPKMSLEWSCESCGSTNGPAQVICPKCGSHKSNVHIRQNKALKPGEKPEGYTPLQQISLTQRLASIPDPENDDDKDSDFQSDFDEGEDGGSLTFDESDHDDDEFKQVRNAPLPDPNMTQEHIGVPDQADPISKLRNLIERHDKKVRSFHALLGGPETDYTNALV